MRREGCSGSNEDKRKQVKRKKRKEKQGEKDRMCQGPGEKKKERGKQREV